MFSSVSSLRLWKQDKLLPAARYLTKLILRDSLPTLSVESINGCFISLVTLVMKWRFCCVCLMFVFPLSSLAGSNQVGKILVQGNKIIESSAIHSKISSKVNAVYDPKKIRRDVRQIFNTGWFYNVEVQKKTGKKITLIYIVKEKPIVGKITYKGNRNLSKKELDDIFHFLPNEFLNHKKIRSAIKNIEEEYEKKSYYLAEVTHSIEQISHPEKVHLVIQIKENKKVKVKRIRFIGNRSISSRKIKSFMGTGETGLLSFISSAGSYSQETLKQDLNNIRFIYMDRGYWKVFVGQPEIVISPNKTDITISVPIQEGEQYKAGTIDFSGDLIFDKEFLKAEMETEESEIFSYGKLQRDIKRLETKYGDKGYAFVNVIPKFFNLPSDDDKTINLLFEIQKGKKVKIGKIHISGNSYTRDKVIRREIRVFEGELYSETNKNRSVENIRRLGFFDDVKMIPKTIKNRDDLVDMEATIKERENLGTLELGTSWDGYNKLSVNGKINKINLFGRGYNIALEATVNELRQYINLNFSDPYFMDSGWYFGSDFYFNYLSADTLGKNQSFCEDFDKQTAKHDETIFKNESERKKSEASLETARKRCLDSFIVPKINYRGFSEQKISGGITLGRSLTDTLRVLFYYRLEHVKLINKVEKGLYPVEESSGLRNPLEASIEYDRRNDRVFPTGGVYSKGSVSYDGIFGKFNYFTLSANARFYQRLFWDFVFRVNIQYSQHLVWDDESVVPIDRLFSLGGIDSLRGFRYFSLGPRKRSNAIYKRALRYGHPDPEGVSYRIFGGTKEFYTNFELQFPFFPGAQLFGVLFVDVGSAYNDFDSIDLRGNWGFGLRVFSPLGPIRLEMGFPFDPQLELGEKTAEFQFTMGFPF